MTEQKRKARDIGVDEYLWAAERSRGLEDMAELLDLKKSTLWDHLGRLGIREAVRNLNWGQGKPGPRKPPMAIVDGVGARTPYDVEEIKRHTMARFEMKDARERRKNDQHIRFDHGPVAIFFLGDQHFGNAGSNVKRAYEEQEAILDTPASYVWQMGDVVDNFIIGKLIRENFKSGEDIMGQWVLAEDYLRGWGDRLLAHLGGNHNAWTLKMAGVDYSKNITPDGVLYDSNQIRATIHVGDFELRVWSRHKWKYNSILNPTHGLEAAQRYDDASYDVHVGAHVHKGAFVREFKGLMPDKRKKLAILSGAYKIHDDYATEQGFPSHDSTTAAGLVIHEDGRFFAASDVYSIQDYMKTVYGRG